MKTKTIIKNGTIFSGEIKKVNTYTASVRSNGDDTVFSRLQIEILDDKGWHSIFVDKNEKLVNQRLRIVNEKSPKVVIGMFELLTLDPEEFDFIIGTLEGAGCEIQ
ncbi:hypothetical protein SAMN05878482_103476 [Peribacillus simplex]|uniref:Uncharacterized protein n=1 Tax=Peribacillus simplex TaxID=1478 RepID=A0A9X8R9L6_9BACI|nr:hypothetical protein [Peribacillus simplex]SIR37892.1 hypothetical protein SAMN05878482_103476 [Peribacillus simplex]